MDQSLSICEELLLLSLDDEEGKLVTSSSELISFTLAGAVLFELMLLGKIEIEDGKLTTLPTEPMGHPVFDLAITRFAKQKKTKALKHWVGQVAKDADKIQKILLEKLVDLGALSEENRTFLWVFKYNRYPTDDSRIEDKIRRRVVESLFGNEPMGTRDYVLLLLIGAARIESEVFQKDQVKEAGRLIKDLKRNDAIGTAISAAIQEFEAMMVIIIASVTTSSIASS
jgi:golgi phosphoprotein 3